MDLSCRRCPKDGKQSFHGADVLAPGRSKLGTVWVFGGEAQLVGSPLEQKDCPLKLEANIRSLCTRRQKLACQRV